MKKQLHTYDDLWSSSFYKWIQWIINGSIFFCLTVLLVIIYLANQKSIDQAFIPRPEPSAYTSYTPSNSERIENGIHIGTGLAYDQNFDLVRGACTSCHSAKLITQNKANREGWIAMIDWMKATQGLQDLGPNESRIVDYLSKHYAPKQSGRRKNLEIKDMEWYDLNLSTNAN